jgi:hypothetical protein
MLFCNIYLIVAKGKLLIEEIANIEAISVRPSERDRAVPSPQRFLS